MKIVSIKSKLPVVENHREEICDENEIMIKLKACGSSKTISIPSYPILDINSMESNKE
jgi:hypothetical protein